MSMDFVIDQGKLTVSGSLVDFPFPVRTAREAGSLLIVLLAIPFDEIFLDNVFAVDSQGKIVWQIQPPAGDWGGKSRLPYENLGMQGDLVSISDFYGLRFFADPKTGEIVGKGQSK